MAKEFVRTSSLEPLARQALQRGAEKGKELAVAEFVRDNVMTDQEATEDWTALLNRLVPDMFPPQPAPAPSTT